MSVIALLVGLITLVRFKGSATLNAALMKINKLIFWNLIIKSYQVMSLYLSYMAISGFITHFARDVTSSNFVSFVIYNVLLTLVLFILVLSYLVMKGGVANRLQQQSIRERYGTIY